MALPQTPFTAGDSVGERLNGGLRDPELRTADGFNEAAPEESAMELAVPDSISRSATPKALIQQPITSASFNVVQNGR